MNGVFMKAVWTLCEEKVFTCFKVETAALLGNKLSDAENVPAEAKLMRNVPVYSSVKWG